MVHILHTSMRDYLSFPSSLLQNASAGKMWLKVKYDVVLFNTHWAQPGTRKPFVQRPTAVPWSWSGRDCFQIGKLTSRVLWNQRGSLAGFEGVCPGWECQGEVVLVANPCHRVLWRWSQTPRVGTGTVALYHDFSIPAKFCWERAKIGS